MACLCACNCTTEQGATEQKPNEDKPVQPEIVTKDVVAYVTTGNLKKQFTRETFNFSEAGSMNPNQITYDKTKVANETIDGFGLAFTTSACFNLLQMSQEDRTAFLEETFSKEKGAGSSLIRVSIGASDFPARNEEYTWCDKEGIENFAVHKEDKELLFPILKEIYAINPDVKILGSPWSAPRWMKCQMPGGNSWDASKFNVPVTVEVAYNSWTGGRLRPSCYDDYAEYFVKWVQAMEKEGFDIYALTMQNEPLNPGNSMSMVMPWQDQLKFIKVLGPAMEKAGLGDVKLMLYDHNYNYDDKEGQGQYPLNIYADPEAAKWAAGSAWHNYGGNVTELDNIYAAYPDKGIWFTESSIGTWNYDSKDGTVGGNFENCLLGDFESIFLGTMERGGKGVIYWNAMLDEKRGPYSPADGSCKTCYGAVTISSKNYKTITKNSHWYNMAQASAVVKPGARRIETGRYEISNLKVQMFLNTDGSIATLILNQASKDAAIVFVNEKFSVEYTVPARSVVSLLWKE